MTIILSSVFCSGQTVSLNGKIIDDATGEPLPYASIYFNATTNGVYSDLEGKFAIEVDPSFTELIISFIGYNTIRYNLDLSQLDRSYKFEMTAESEELQEVEVKSTRGKLWFENLKVFTKQFIGSSSLASKTKIVNPEVLQFNFDKPSNTFSAIAKSPIVIENDALGYIIEYDLEGYIHDYQNKRVSFLGYSRFIEMDGSKRKKKKWLKERQRAYNGSPQHFFRSLINRSAAEEGFIIQQVTKSPNPNRPTEEQIQTAKAKVKAITEFGVSEIPDSIQSILKRQSQPKHILYLDTTALDYAHYIRDTLDGSVIVSIKDQWQVTYTKEKVDQFYRNASSLSLRSNKGPQVSLLSMSTSSTIVNNNGLPMDPLTFLFEKYWGFEKVGDMLPVDFIQNSQ